MKTLLLPLVLLSWTSSVHAATLATWTFESSIPATAGPHAAEVGSGSASGFHTSGSAVYSNPAGNGSAESFSSNFWAVGDYYQYTANTTGMTDVTIALDHASSSTGPRDFEIYYSTDGTTFTTTGFSYSVLVSASPVAWNSTTGYPVHSQAFNLSAITDLNNQSTIYLRFVVDSLVTAGGTTVASFATAGSSRMDNVTINAVPEPATALLGAFGLLGLLRRRR